MAQHNEPHDVGAEGETLRLRKDALIVLLPLN